MKSLQGVGRLPPEVEPLLALAERLTKHLVGLEQRLVPEDSPSDFDDGRPTAMLYQGKVSPGLEFQPEFDLRAAEGRRKRTDYLKRAISLGEHAQAVVLMIERALYPAGFSLLRTVLEHVVFDRLLFLADRHEYKVRRVSREEYDGFLENSERNLEGLKPEDRARFESRQAWRYQPNPNNPEYGGVMAIDIEAGSYWRYARSYNPFPEHIEGIEDEAGAIDQEFTKGKVRLWRNRLSWGRLLAGLELNEICETAEMACFRTLHAFLSGYTHPVSFSSRERLFGEGPARHDHCTAELALLVVCCLLRAELAAFGRLAGKEPRVELGHWAEVESDLDQAERLWDRLCDAASQEGTDVLLWVEATHRGDEPAPVCLQEEIA